jgi:Tol biopolymer transport system component
MYFWQNNQAGPCEGIDCRYVVMYARDLGTGRDREIFRMNGNITGGGIAISPDGQQRAFVSRGALMVAPTAGGPPRAISGLPSSGVSSLAWTRNGSHVLVFRRAAQGPGGEVWSISLKGGSPEKSTLRMQPSGEPAVSPDGTQIAFVGGGRKSEIWVMTGLLQDAKPSAPR